MRRNTNKGRGIYSSVQSHRQAQTHSGFVDTHIHAEKLDDFSSVGLVSHRFTADIHYSQANLASLTWSTASLWAAVGQPSLLFPLTINVHASPYPSPSPNTSPFPLASLVPFV